MSVLGGRAAMFASVAACALAAPAMAQVEAEPAEEAPRFGQDIIVTAERRATDLQDTPLSIVAVTDEIVAAKGIDDLADLGSFTPNLNITPSRGNGGAIPSFSIRGISGGGGAVGERGVGLYIDGVFVPRTSGSVLLVLDVDRIEVLRGPQGTLFGRNSTGGAIRIFTKQPELQDFGGYIRVTAGNMDRADVIGTVNVPLGDTVAVRAQGAYLSQGGFVERGTQDLGGSEDVIGRLNVRFEPTDRFEATAGFLYSNSKASRSACLHRVRHAPGHRGSDRRQFRRLAQRCFQGGGASPAGAVQRSAHRHRRFHRAEHLPARRLRSRFRQSLRTVRQQPLLAGGPSHRLRHQRHAAGFLRHGRGQARSRCVRRLPAARHGGPLDRLEVPGVLSGTAAQRGAVRRGRRSGDGA
ncbi:TonB-dependent receptor plug domain-containing protein [Altererythrobacter soli]|uniref:TonB-dependent receptor plug domain-containing protein n=1 Tax=Croceibacterium soli TaxID=1739690 RepID=A0A6I4UVM3_9SPHN|nr:TonB-dependent receptor plug domain-containing protein [Croceibacterium soli]